MDQCSKCRYFKNKQGPGKGGTCRRYPPSFAVPNYSMAFFPPMKPTNWCGEFHRDPRLVRVHQPDLEPNCNCNLPDCTKCMGLEGME